MPEPRARVTKFKIAPIFRALGGECNDYATGKQKVLCPFHDDSRPSASIDFTNQRFLCFTCGVGGDGLDLLISQEGLSFSAALERAQAITGDQAAPVRPAERAAPALFARPRAGRASN